MTTTNDTTTSQTTNTPAEPSMEEYAAMRQAEIRGDKPAQATAAAADATPPAAATEDQNDDQSAAATDEDDIDGKTTTESATEDETVDEDQQASKGKKGINKRFSELTAEKKAAQAEAEKARADAEVARREAEQARQEAERLRLEAERAQNAIPKVPEAANDPKPGRTEFDDPDAYVEAIAAWTAREEQRISNVRAKEEAEARAVEARAAADEARKQQVFKAVQDLNANFQKKVAESKTDYPDYDEKVTNNESIQLRNDVFFAIQQAPDSPHLLYHLADHPDEAESLNKLSPLQVAMRLGELQAELRVARKPKPSKAAEPIRPVGNRQSPQPKKPEEMTTDEYARHMEQQAQASGQRGRVRIL